MKGLVCLLVGGPDYIIDVQGRDVLFEWHDYAGPMPVTKTGAEAKSIGPRHMFWTVVTWWSRQGKRVDDKGRCIYDWPPHRSEVMRHLGGKHWKLNGDCRGFDIDDIMKHGRTPTAEAAKEPT